MFTRSIGIVFTIITICSCSTNQRLVEGTWTGAMTPQNHPDLETPIEYMVDYEEGRLVMTLIGPGKTKLPISNIVRSDGKLEFQFTEPEEGVALTCELHGVPDKGYSGKCKDEAGKWARFTFVPPK